LARAASDGDDRVAILDKEKFRKLVCDGVRFLSLRGYLGASEGEDVRQGEAGGVGPELRRSSGIESDELVVTEPPCSEPEPLCAEFGVVALKDPGLDVGMLLPFTSVIVVRELGVGGKLRESGEGSRPDCRGMDNVGSGAGTCF
jgi:hypothetical protein